MTHPVATGATITFGTSGYTFNLLNLDWDGVERAAIETSHHGTVDWKTFVPGEHTDPGNLSLEIEFDGGVTPPFHDAPETITVTVPGAPTADTWAAEGFVNSFSFGAPLEDKLTANVGVKLSDAITITPGV